MIGPQTMLLLNKKGEVTGNMVRANNLDTLGGNVSYGGEPTVELRIWSDESHAMSQCNSLILTKESWETVFQDIMDIFDEMEEDQ